MTRVHANKVRADHPANAKTRPAVEVLCASPEPIGACVRDPERYFREVDRGALRGRAEVDLHLRVEAVLARAAEDGAPEEDESHVAESIAALARRRIIAIAGEMFCLHEPFGAVAAGHTNAMARSR